jgi:zinc transport system substrate-binding protein
VNEGANGPEIEHLAYSESLPEGKTTTLLGGVGLQYWLGNYGADRVVIIDPSGSEAFRLVDLPTRRVHFAVDPQNVKFAYIFTEDGALHQLNVLSGSITKSLQVTEPYSMDGEWSLPRPRIAVAGDVVAVTDPLKSVVRLIGTGDFTEAGLIAVEGMPYNIVAVGASGEVH